MRRRASILLLAALPFLAFGQRAGKEAGRGRVGPWEVVLRVPADGLIAGEEMDVEFRVENMTNADPVTGGEPLIRARISGVVDMPSMKSMPRYEEIAHPEGIPGDYGLHPVFPHGGEYRLSLSIQPPGGGGKEFDLQFTLQVSDAVPGRKRKPRPAPYSVDMRNKPEKPKPGEPVALEFRFYARDEPKDPLRRFDIAHEKYMHLLVMRNDWRHSAHVHPEPSPDGVFRLSYTFPAPGVYHLFSDVAPAGRGSQLLLTRLEVAGTVTDRFDVSTAEPMRTALAGPFSAALPPSPLPAGRTMPLEIAIREAGSGQPVTNLEPYLGAMGHLMLVHEDATTFVHSHPDERIPGAGKDGKLPFLARFPKPGRYRGWLEIQRQGVVTRIELLVAAAP